MKGTLMIFTSDTYTKVILAIHVPFHVIKKSSI